MPVTAVKRSFSLRVILHRSVSDKSRWYHGIVYYMRPWVFAHGHFCFLCVRNTAESTGLREISRWGDGSAKHLIHRKRVSPAGSVTLAF